MNIEEIKAAVDNGSTVKCDNGTVIKDAIGQYLIVWVANGSCIALHGEGKFANVLNSENFHV